MYAGLLILAWPLGSAVAQEFRWHAPVTPYVPPGLVDAIVADMNLDGRPDLVTTHVSQYGQIAVSLQREDGNFDFPLLYRCDCAPSGPKILKRNDGWPLIAYDSGINPNVFPNLSRYGIGILELRPDLSFDGIRYNNITSDQMGVVDVNNDGNDDLFATYYDEDSTTPEMDFRYVVWYAGSATKRDTPSSTSNPRLAFHAYRSDRFTYSGIKDLTFSSTYILGTNIDVDADGYQDHMEGRCPGQCLFRQQPYRQLTATPMTTSPDLGESVGQSGFGDLDGDGLPEQLHAYTGYYDADMRIFRQKAPLDFEEVATYGPLYAPSIPLVFDVDNNGLNDIVVQTEYYTLSETGWLDTLLQVRPGEFEVIHKRIGSHTGGLTIQALDIDRDGCVDLAVRSRIPGSLDRGLLLWHGTGCQRPTDFSVMIEGTAAAPIVKVTNVMGSGPTAPRIVRVTLAPAVRDADAIGYAVDAPQSCNAVEAVPPRKTFDCLLPSIAAPPGRVDFAFQVRVAAGQSIDTQTTAFLLDTAGDLDRSNNRAVLRQPIQGGQPQTSQGDRR